MEGELAVSDLQLDRIERKLDRLLAVLEKYEPLLGRLDMAKDASFWQQRKAMKGKG